MVGVHFPVYLGFLDLISCPVFYVVKSDLSYFLHDRFLILYILDIISGRCFDGAKQSDRISAFL